MDESDQSNEISCALRETEEELGIDQKSIRVLGVFHDMLSLNSLIGT